jgi:peptide deformylase
MTVRDILLWPDTRLSTSCAPVTEITKEIATLAEDMLDTMYAAPGRGLAAPQIGAMHRLFVMDEGWKDGAPEPRVFLNPEVAARSVSKSTREEGCLSLPGISVDVARPESVTLRWTDLDGTTREEAFSGFAAACVQHEIDHLDGVVTLDHLDPQARAQVLTAYEEANP